MRTKMSVAQAISAARGTLRSQGFRPENADESAAFESLSSLPSDTLGSEFYFYATNGQYRSFCAEWRKWRKTLPHHTTK